MTGGDPVGAGDPQAFLQRRGQIPEAITLAWNLTGSIVLACAAIRARSVALAAGKARAGRAPGNPVLITEGRVTLVDSILAVAVL
jgi:hypothetical protein